MFTPFLVQSSQYLSFFRLLSDRQNRMVRGMHTMFSLKLSIYLFIFKFGKIMRVTWQKRQTASLFCHPEKTYPPFGSAASQWPRQWPHHRVAALPQWEPSRGWAGPTGSSPRSTRPRLPAAACTGGAPPGTAALWWGSGVEREERPREKSRIKDV